MHEEIIFSYTEKFKTVDQDPISSSFWGVPIKVQCSKLGTFTVVQMEIVIDLEPLLPQKSMMKIERGKP